MNNGMQPRCPNE